MTINDVVVGVDGSTPSLDAVRWAALEAVRRNARLRALNAYHLLVVDLYGPVGGDLANEAEGAAKLVVDAAVAEAKAVAPELDVTGVTVLGTPAQTLIDAGRSAEMVVVGSRGHGGFAGALVGATSQQVAMHASCPVVVVRGRDDATSGPVVVGVDGSKPAAAALDLAFQQAAARNCGLIALRAYEQPLPPFGKGPAVLMEPPRDAEARVRAELADIVAEVAPRYPDVEVEQLVTFGNAAQVLFQLSHSAQLVVVGTRGHGGFTGLLLGSIGLHLIHHADCPVMVTRLPHA
jgi:nucleotide-binding universal stress UspA family protein